MRFSRIVLANADAAVFNSGKIWCFFIMARYLSELLHAMKFSYQKATFVASKRDKEAREKWLKNEWPEILRLATEKNAYVLFGDESSLPQWGSLSYTWAPIGQQPVIETWGTRKSYKVFGLIDYFTGKFFSTGHEGKLNADSYISFFRGSSVKNAKTYYLDSRWCALSSSLNSSNNCNLMKKLY